MLQRHLGRERAARRSPAASIGCLSRDDAIDETRESLDRLHRGITKRIQSALGESFELELEDCVPQLFLRLEVVIEMALATQPGLANHIIYGRVSEALTAHDRCCGLHYLCSSIFHAREYKTGQSISQVNV